MTTKSTRFSLALPGGSVQFEVQAGTRGHLGPAMLSFQRQVQPLLSFRQVLDQGIKRIRLPIWTPGSYIRMPDNKGMWCEVYDPACQAAIGEPTPQMMIIFSVCRAADTHWETWEVYDGPPCAGELAKHPAPVVH